MKAYLTAKDTNFRLTPVEMADGGGGGTVVVDSGKRFQTLLGFGGAFTEAAAYTFSRMSAAKQSEIIDLYYKPGFGLGYRLGRMAIASSDFALGVYDYVSDGDVTLDSFDMSHEEKWVIPMIRAAEKASDGKIALLASPWSPPAYMKTNNSKLNGGSLREDMYGVWARHFVKFVEAARGYGLNISWLSVQNEPDNVTVWDSCVYTAEAERDFVKNHLGPALDAAGMSDVKLVVHDHNRDNMLRRVLPILADSGAAKYIWGTGIHWYVSEDFTATAILHDTHPDKHIILTEACQEGGLHLGAWHTGERYGRNIIGDLTHGVEAWIEWNLVLDETGGPNHVGNFCDALIVCDTPSDSITINSSYYYMGHFSKFIKPGAVRIGCESTNKNLLSLAAQNPDGSICLVVQNETDSEHALDVSMPDMTASHILPPHSIATYLSK